MSFTFRKTAGLRLKYGFRAWIKKTHERIMTRLDRVQLGNFGDHKTVGGGVSELRFFFGSGYRVYYGIGHGQLVLLLTGGNKKSQNKDIARAQKYWNLYLKET